MKHTLLSASVIAALALGASGAMAQGITVKLGWVNIDPSSSATPVAGPFTPVDALGLKVQPQSTLFFSLAKDINANMEVELAAGVPPRHDGTLVILKPTGVPGSVAALDGQLISRVRQVAPTLFANYKFGDSNSQLRPFVGVGLNFTRFDQTESTAVNNAVNGGPTTIKMTDSFGPAAQLGLSVKLGGPWSVTGSWSTARVKSTVTTNTLGIERTSQITFHPSVATVAVGYSF